MKMFNKKYLGVYVVVAIAIAAICFVFLKSMLGLNIYSPYYVCNPGHETDGGWDYENFGKITGVIDTSDNNRVFDIQDICKSNGQLREFKCASNLNSWVVEYEDYTCENGLCVGGECVGLQCTQGAWQEAGCGAGTCAAGFMKYTRTVTPSGCAEESKCVQDSTKCCQDSCAPSDKTCTGNILTVCEENSYGCLKPITKDCAADGKICEAGDCVFAPQCRIDSECADSNLCTVDKCTSGVCSNAAKTCESGFSCDIATGNCIELPCTGPNCELMCKDYESKDVNGKCVIDVIKVWNLYKTYIAVIAGLLVIISGLIIYNMKSKSVI